METITPFESEQAAAAAMEKAQSDYVTALCAAQKSPTDYDPIFRLSNWSTVDPEAYRAGVERLCEACFAHAKAVAKQIRAQGFNVPCWGVFEPRVA